MATTLCVLTLKNLSDHHGRGERARCASLEQQDQKTGNEKKQDRIMKKKREVKTGELHREELGGDPEIPPKFKKTHTIPSLEEEFGDGADTPYALGCGLDPV